MFKEYKLADGSVVIVEVTEEVAAFLDEDDRRRRNADRKERDHAPYSIDAREYEGLCYAAPEEKDEDEETRRMEKYLSVLTETQRRRCRMRLEGMTFQEIADTEGADYSSVVESVYAAKKKLRKKFPKIFSKTPHKNGT